MQSEVANKIAAGEVIERPSSVLKELLENSIDAGASHIDIKLLNSGIKEIIVRDNGCGIIKEDLKLSLQQHATSKIRNIKDLIAIDSLGFRGEALSSIAYVSHIQITSKTINQEYAWNLNKNKISIAAHPTGTTISIKDLFYNLPVRKKFMRSERTEYQYLEEIFRRIALSNLNISFMLYNNDKLIKSFPRCTNEQAKLQRVIKLCRRRKCNLLKIDFQQNTLKLHGWLGSVESLRIQEPHQYFFINGRIIKDRLINHAIKKIYQKLYEQGIMPFYCLYLELNPYEIDINVHPTKHEVRFRNARTIHAFIHDALSNILDKSTSNFPKKKNKNKNYISLHNIQQKKNKNNFKILTTINGLLSIAQQNNQLFFLNLRSPNKFWSEISVENLLSLLE